MKLAFSTIGCPNWSYDEVVSTASDLGYDGFEVRGIGGEIYAPDVKQFKPENIEKTKEKLKSLGLGITMLTSGASLAVYSEKEKAVAEAKAYIALAESLGVPYMRLKTDIKEVVFDVRKEDNPCSLCAKMRRGALCTALSERGITKLALGHHFDDAVETFLLSLVYEGRISCFQPVTHMTRTGVDQIRPMLYAGEGRITNLAKALALPIVENPCPEDRGSKRHEVKELIRTMSLTYPDLRSKVFGAIQRAPLDGWKKAR